MSISSTGVIGWANPVAGISTITVRADNGKAYAQQSYQLTIGTQPLPLTVAAAVAPAVINAGQTTTITVAANGGTGNITTALKIDGQSVTLTPGTTANTASATVTGTKVGAHLITASATDSKGTASQTTVYSVADPSDTGSPVAQITSPILDATLTNATPVIGTASDQNLAYYQLLLAPSGSANWSEIARGYSNVTNGTLGTFDPTTLPNGIYQLNLNVVNVNGVQTSQMITVEVNSHLKIGQFSLSFQDLNINASGIPIQITRTYDTRKKAQNLDFGQGWSIDYQNVQINKNVQIGVNWNVAANAGALTLCINPGQQHKVDIILPTGELARFTASNSPQCAFGVIPDVNIQFTPLPGTTSSLAIENVPEGLIPQGGVLFDQTGDSGGDNSWNPRDYALTTADNFVYHITEGIGITSVTDPNGNTLTYGQNGILHSNGTGVAFTRDANGHITQITDPSGKSINYTYSATGDLLTMSDRNNATSKMTYDQSHGLASYTDPNGNLLARYVYDATGKLIAAYDANGSAIQTQRNPNQDVVTDQRGNKTTYTYDNNGNITQITNALSQTTTYTYDANGNQASVTDAAGNTTLTTYDPQSYLQTGETDALGHTTTSGYDSATHSRLTSTIDANGNRTTYSYFQSGTTTVAEPLGRSSTAFINSAGNLSQFSIAGRTIGYGYDTSGNKISETDAEGNTISYTYDANGNQLSQSWKVNGQVVTSTQTFDSNGRVVSRTDALGNTTRTQYSAGGQIVATIDAQGRTTGYSYDSTGKLAVTSYPDGTTESNTYDSAGNRISTTDRLGRTTHYLYDAINRLISTIQPDSSSLSTAYNAEGWTATIVDAKGNITTNGYDAAGRLLSTTDAQGKKTGYGYDAVGNQISSTDSLGNVTQFKYDALNHLVQTTYPDGTTSSTVWRTDGKKSSDTNQKGNTTSYGYDLDGRLNQVTQTNAATQQQTLFGYDANGKKTSQTDANGNKTTWSYDANSKLVGRILPGGQQESLQYDVNGNVTLHTDFNGKTTNYAYDSNGRLIQEQRPDGTTIVFLYTAAAQIASGVVSNSGNGKALQPGATVYTYDALDRLTKQTNPDGSFIAYAYDATGNVTQRSTSKGTVVYAYDSNQRMVSLTDINGETTNYYYDGNGNRTGVTGPNGITSSYFYDSSNRITLILHRAKSGAVLDGEAYVLAQNGQRVQIQELDGQSTAANNVPANPARTTVYSYDGVNRLVNEVLTDRNGNSTAIAYQYDTVGNRSQKTVTTSGGTETVAYVYDGNDRLTTETDTLGATQTQTNYTWDANGNLRSKTIAGLITLYQWDSQNHLIEVDQGTSPATASFVAKYVYDPAGNRVQKIEPGNKITNFLTDGNSEYSKVLEEDVTQNGTTIATTYTWSDHLVSINNAGNQNYVLADALHSTKLLIDGNGNATDTYSYDAFGRATHSGSSANPYRYTGEFFDDLIGLQYNRARYYDSVVGRFVSSDSAAGDRESPISLNKYVYANANPVNLTDPSGLESLAELSAAEDIQADLAEAGVEAGENFAAGAGRSVFNKLGDLAENGVRKILNQCIGPKNVGKGILKKTKVNLDFEVQLAGKLLNIESKYQIPKKGSEAMFRLVRQIQAAAAEGKEVLVFSGKKLKSRAQDNRLKLLKELSGVDGVSIISGFVDFADFIENTVGQCY